MLAQKLASQGVKNPGGLAYSIGAKKYGSATMAKAAATSTPAAVVAKKARK
jgi:hypothetical protein